MWIRHIHINADRDKSLLFRRLPYPIVAANTSMHPIEVKNLRWQDLDLFAGTVTVRRSKNLSSHRVIPLNKSAREAFMQMHARSSALGISNPEHFIWPASQWGKMDPIKPTKK